MKPNTMNKILKVVEHARAKSGLCSEERSMISPDYARNFICDFILGKEQAHSQPQLWSEYENTYKRAD